MRTIEHDHSRARRLVITLVNVQIAVFEIERDGQTFALNRGEQGCVDVEVDRVAKLVTFTRRRGFDTCSTLTPRFRQSRLTAMKLFQPPYKPYVARALRLLKRF